MELSPHLKWWLAQASGPKSNEVRNYIKFLESEIERLKYFSPYKEDYPDSNPPEPLNPGTALFNSYGG
jgi:hypothetical protein